MLIMCTEEAVTGQTNESNYALKWQSLPTVNGPLTTAASTPASWTNDSSSADFPTTIDVQYV